MLNCEAVAGFIWNDPYIYIYIQCSLDIMPTWGFDKSWHYKGVALYGGGEWGNNLPK